MLLFLLLALLLMVGHVLVQMVLQERRYRRQLPAHIPTVSAVPLIGALWQMRHFQPDNLPNKFEEYVGRYGRNFAATICGRLVVVTADPNIIDLVLQSKQHIRKSHLYGALRSWLGDGLLLSSGYHWHAMRKFIAPTFHVSILKEYVEVFDRQGRILIRRLKVMVRKNPSRPINIYPLLGMTTLDIITEAAMGVSVNAQLDKYSPEVRAINNVTNVLATRFMRPHLLPPLLLRLVWPKGYSMLSTGIQQLHRFTNDIIDRRRRLMRSNPLEKKRLALLDTLLQAQQRNREISNEQIRDEVSTFIFAGHDTTTTAASFCLYLLSRHWDVQQRLFEELVDHFGDDVNRPVVYSDFPNLTYLNCVIKESLRLYPPIPAVGRCLENNLMLGGQDVLPRGTNVIILIWQLLRDKDIYKDPLRFWPERHLPNTTNVSYIPFSAGPRNCIGQRFALLELKTIVILMLRHFELLPYGEGVKPSIKIVLRSANGVNIGLRQRS